jgi:hypothetical protein
LRSLCTFMPNLLQSSKAFCISSCVIFQDFTVKVYIIKEGSEYKIPAPLL